MVINSNKYPYPLIFKFQQIPGKYLQISSRYRQILEAYNSHFNKKKEPNVVDSFKKGVPIYRYFSSNSIQTTNQSTALRWNVL